MDHVESLVNMAIIDGEHTEADLRALRRHVAECIHRGILPVGPHPLRETEKGPDPSGPTASWPDELYVPPLT